MKKLLGILVLGLLFISIDLSNPTRVEAAKSFEEVYGKLEPEKGFIQNIKKKYRRYKQKKEACANEAAYAENSFSAKKVYNACMDR